MILLVDGRSGSGKTEFARALGAQQLVRLDDLYPGWEGLRSGSEAVVTLLTEGRWRRWDWERSAPAEWNRVDLGRDLVVEGCGALTARSRALATHAVWVELDEPDRKSRALARDPYYAPHWDAWAAQEEEHLARDNPRALADEVVDGRDVGLAAARWRAEFQAEF